MPHAFGPSWLDPAGIVDTFGAYALVAVLVIVFAECGLLLGFFLPGDTLLFTVGVLIATDVIDTPLWLAATLIAVAAVLGNVVGYEIGRRAGPALFRRPESRMFRPEYVEKTAQFFEKHGPPAIVLARFVPVVRTFITAMAGAARMDFRIYLTYSAIGGVLWGAGVTVLGYFLGQIEFVRDNIENMERILIAVILISVALPLGHQMLRMRRGKSKPSA